ncbi:MAG TPA: hypothetical protein ACQGQH_08360 [Xylella sp.]
MIVEIPFPHQALIDQPAHTITQTISHSEKAKNEISLQHFVIQHNENTRILFKRIDTQNSGRMNPEMVLSNEENHTTTASHLRDKHLKGSGSWDTMKE